METADEAKDKRIALFMNVKQLCQTNAQICSMFHV